MTGHTLLLLSMMVALIILYQWGIGDRYGGYIIKKRGKVWEVSHAPRLFLFWRNRASFLAMREASFGLLAAELPDNVSVLEQSLWLDGRHDQAGSVTEEPMAFGTRILGLLPYWQNPYNWRPSRIFRKGHWDTLYKNTWTAEEFRARFGTIQRERHEQGISTSLLFFFQFTTLVSLTLVFSAMQITQNNSIYDTLYTASDAAALGGASQQQTAIVAYNGGFPSTWTQTIIPTNATAQIDSLLYNNLAAALSPSFISNHVYLGNSPSPGYSDSFVNSNIQFTTATYNGQTYDVGVILNLPIRYDTTMMDAMMMTLEGHWSGTIGYTLYTKSTIPFLLYDSAHPNGYEPNGATPYR